MSRILYDVSAKKYQGMDMINELSATLKEHLKLRKQRADCLLQIIFALFQARTVNLVDIADFMNPDVDKKSNYRRLQRFFGEITFCQNTIAKLLFSFFTNRPN